MFDSMNRSMLCAPFPAGASDTWSVPLQSSDPHFRLCNPSLLMAGDLSLTPQRACARERRRRRRRRRRSSESCTRGARFFTEFIQNREGERRLAQELEQLAAGKRALVPLGNIQLENSGSRLQAAQGRRQTKSVALLRYRRKVSCLSGAVLVWREISPTPETQRAGLRATRKRSRVRVPISVLYERHEHNVTGRKACLRS